MALLAHQFAHIFKSVQYKDGNRLRMLSGPLKAMEGQNIRVDKQGRSGQARPSVHGKSVLVWLGFELVGVLSQQGLFEVTQEGAE